MFICAAALAVSVAALASQLGPPPEPLPELTPEPAPTPSVEPPPAIEPREVPSPSAPVAEPVVPPTAEPVVPPVFQPLEKTRLVYVPGAFRAACPDERALVAGVTQRLGEDPFGEPATRIVVVTLSGPGSDAVDAAPTRADLELFDAALSPLGSRTLESTESCAELVAAAALAVSVALDPARALGPKPVDAPAPQPQNDDDNTVVIPSEPPWRPWAGTLVVRAGGHFAYLLAPGGVTLGRMAGVGLRGPWWSLHAEVRGDGPPSPTVVGFTGVSGASLLPCAHAALGTVRDGVGDTWGVVGCGNLSGGIAWGLGDVVALSPYLGLGGRVGVEWVQPDGMSFQLFTDLQGAVVPAVGVRTLTGTVQVGAPVHGQVGLLWELPLP